MIGIDTNSNKSASIKVIGIGGGGGNAINNMIAKGLTGVEFIAANTDNQALEHNSANIKVQLGKDTTKGLGAGADPEMGKNSVHESNEDIVDALKDSDMVFITAGMGGGTGTGGAPEIAKIAKEMDTLTVAIVTKPFLWEGKRRLSVAEEWIEELRENVDALIVIPNQRLLEIIDKKTSFKDAFLKVDEVLYNATRGISDIISQHGVVNVDFADVKTVMKGMGDALMGIGTASGDNRAVEATQDAINSPLLDGISIEGAKGVLVNITGGSDMTMFEISEAVSIVEEAAGGNANIIHGVVYKEDLEDELMVTVVATGFSKENNSVGKKQRLETIKNTENSLRDSENLNNTAKEFTRSPKGVNQLQKFQEPAIIRDRGKNKARIGEQKEFMKNKLNNNHQKEEQPTHNERKEDKQGALQRLKETNYALSEKPAFIRKIMD